MRFRIIEDSRDDYPVRVMRWPSHRPATMLGALGRTAPAEHQLRQRIAQMVAAQVIEDEDNNLADDDHVGYHAYNAVLKRVFQKSRSEMAAAELEAAVGWRERNRISDHLVLLADDPQYRWSSRRQVRRRSQ